MGCKDKLEEMFGKLSKDEIKEIISDIEKKQKTIRTGEGEPVAELLKMFADKAIKEKEYLAREQMRKASIKILRENELRKIIDKDYKGDAFTGLRNLLTHGAKGRSPSAEFRGKAIESKIFTSLLKDLEADHKGITKLFRDKPFNEAVAVELGELKQGGTPGKSGNEDAMHVAKVFDKHKEILRKMANEAGATIKKLDGHIVAQTHDITKMRKMGVVGWSKYILPLLDKERTFGDALDEKDVEKFLTDVYANITTGIHGSMKAEERGVTGGIMSLANLVSKERELHFRDTASFLAYNDNLGTGSVLEGLFRGITRMSEKNGIMQVMGPDPEATLEKLMAEYARKTRKGVENLILTKAKQETLRREFETVAGIVETPENPTLARVMTNVRSMNSMAYLGMALFSSVNDIPTVVANANYHGIGFLEAYTKVFRNLLKVKRPQQEREIVNKLLGVWVKGVVGSAKARFGVNEGAHGIMSNMTNAFFKLSGLDFWTDRLKEGHALMLSSHLADNINQDYKVMDESIRRGLLRYGIGEEKWNIIKQARAEMSDGIHYLTPDAIRSLPDEAFGKGMTMKPVQLKKMKAELENDFRAFFLAEADTAVITPGERERAMFVRGTPGTVWGEVSRSVIQFKFFPLSMATKVFPRLAEQGVPAIVHFALMMTLFGYAGNTLKDLAKGKGLRDPRKKQTVLDAMLAGGAASIYTDFIFKDYNRYGGSFVETVAGPTVGTASDFFKIFSFVKGFIGDGETDSLYEGGKKAVRFATQRMPFANLFYTKAALDYLFLYSLNETLNPGATRRMEDRIKEEYGQSYLGSYKPSKHALGM